MLLDKDLCQRTAAVSCEHLSQGPGDLVEPGLKGFFFFFLTVMLTHELRAEASVYMVCGPGRLWNTHISMQITMLVGGLVP